MQNYIIETDDTGKEMMEHGDSLFPVAGYDEYFSKFVLGEVPWHWHDEIELVIVCEGVMVVEYVDHRLTLREGEAIFVNSNVLHRMTDIGEVDCHIINFVLKPVFLGGSYESRIYTKYIQPVCDNTCHPAITFNPEQSKDSVIIENLRDAFEAYTTQGFGYEITVRNHLMEVWKLMCMQHPELLEQIQNDIESSVRVSDIIKYIHSHYDEKLTVKRMAESIGISESECFRLFKKVLKTTPNDCLLNHRLQMAALQLASSDETVLVIGMNNGFNSPSYFSQKFKEKYNLTPKAFRKQHLTTS